MKSTLRSIFLALIFIPIWATAQNMGEAWLQVTRDLKSQGLERIGQFHIQTFEDRALKIDWQLFSPENRPKFMDGRTSAYYLRNANKVYVSNQLPEILGPSLSMLELHESLGATGYPDQNYQLSTALHMLSQMPKGAKKNEVLKAFGEGLFKSIKRSTEGSGSSVGGGGDLIALAVKYQVLHKILKRADVTSSFLAAFPEVVFEPFYEPQKQFVALHYQARPKHSTNRLPGARLQKGGYQELITIYVPARDWTKKPKIRAKTVDQIVSYILSIFPAYANTPMTSVVPLTCPGKSVRFPKAANSDMLLMQQLRGNVILGCDPMVLFTALQVPSFDLPKKVEPNSYACVLNLDGDKTEYTLKVTKMNRDSTQAFVTANTSKAGTIIADTMVWATITMNTKGQVTQIRFLEKFVGQDEFLYQRVKDLKPGQPIQFKSKSYSGRPMSFSCGASRG